VTDASHPVPAAACSLLGVALAIFDECANYCLFPDLENAIRDGRTGYCPAAGIPLLRQALANGLGKQRGGACDSDTPVTPVTTNQLF
jgi:hypothetical protein